MAGGVVGGRVSFGEERTAVPTTWARRAPGRIYAGRPCRRPTPEPARPLIYGVSCVRAWGHKNQHWFFTVFCALGRAQLLRRRNGKKTWFLRGFGSAEGSGKEKLASWRSFNIGPKMGQHGANIGPRQGQHRPS